MGLKTIWALIRPYFTVTRVVALVTSLLTPVAAVVIGWLAVKLADAGIDLNQTQAMVVFLGGVASVLAVVVPIVRKWLDGRAGFEQEMVKQGLAAQISSKSIASQKVEQARETPQDTPEVGVVGTSQEFPPAQPDDDYLLSQDHENVAPDDAPGAE